MKLSEHLSLSEIERSDLASYHGIDNSLPPEMLPTWIRIATEIFEPLREALGVPIFVTSGYRCPALAKLAHEQRGATLNSQHNGRWHNVTDGRDYYSAALDLWHPDGCERRHAFRWFYYNQLLLPIDRLIWEFGWTGPVSIPHGQDCKKSPDWVHISTVPGIEFKTEGIYVPRREILRSYREESPTKITYIRI